MRIRVIEDIGTIFGINGQEYDLDDGDTLSKIGLVRIFNTAINDEFESVDSVNLVRCYGDVYRTSPRVREKLRYPNVRCRMLTPESVFSRHFRRRRLHKVFWRKCNIILYEIQDMGIVRREGNWRLDKQEAGVYEVTFKHQPELKIVTSDYSPRGFMNERMDFSIEVRDVDSFSDAEALFEKMAQGNSSQLGGLSMPIGINESTTFEESTGNNSLSNLPPIGALLFGALVGGVLISSSGLVIQSTSFLIGLAFLILPIIVLALTYREYDSNGLKAAITYLFTAEESKKDKTRSEDETPGRTPPAPQKLKNDLYFERAGRKCEWCNELIDSHETHHIKPRSEGGPNEPENLIVLCPNCHDKADRGMISRSKLKRVVSKDIG